MHYAHLQVREHGNILRYPKPAIKEELMKSHRVLLSLNLALLTEKLVQVRVHSGTRRALHAYRQADVVPNLFQLTFECFE